MELSEGDDHRGPPPRPPDRLKVLQWNVLGLRGKRSELLQAIVEEDLDLVLLQETLEPEHVEWRLAGYTVHALPRDGDGRRGCMVVVRSSLPHQRIPDPVHCGLGVEVMAVLLQLPGLSLTVYNVYCSPRRQLEAGELLSLAAHTNVLVAGDFNAHHPLLQSVSPTNAAGLHLAAMLEEVPHIALLNNGEPTHLRRTAASPPTPQGTGSTASRPARCPECSAGWLGLLP